MENTDIAVAYLSSPRLRVLLLDLDFAHIAGMLNDLGNVRLVPSTDLARDALSQVCESTIHPVLPEDTNAVAVWRKIGLDHAESAMDGPEDEEDNEEMVRVPEALKVCPSRLLCCCQRNRHQCEEHDVSTPAGACCKVGKNKAHEPEVVGGRESGKVVPMRDGVDPGKEDD
jgi:hypothetical protein